MEASNIKAIKLYEYALEQIDLKDKEIKELKKKIDEYERQPELMAETALEALRTLQEQDAEIAKLRKCLKEAVDYCCSLCKSKGKACEFDGFCAEQRWRKALEGSNNATK